jgi:predicted PurR-regulated permease PerM
MYLVGMASVFVILFGIRGTASIICPILLAAVITITVLPVPSSLTKRGVPGWLSLVLTITSPVPGSGLRGVVGAAVLVHGLHSDDRLLDCHDPAPALGVR